MTDADDALLRAAQAVDLAAVTIALQNGANVNARDPGFGRTALMWASMHGSVPIMTALVDADADVNLQATLGETALIMAASARGGGERMGSVLEYTSSTLKAPVGTRGTRG